MTTMTTTRETFYQTPEGTIGVKRIECLADGSEHMDADAERTLAHAARAIARGRLVVEAESDDDLRPTNMAPSARRGL